MRFVIPFIFMATYSALAAEARVEFNRDIRPILAAKCYACHGPDEDKREADLRLDVRAEAVKAAIKPGQPEASELWKRITHTDPDDVMPPPSSPKQLTKIERDLIRRWIAAGAEYQSHWAFEPIKRPVVPQSDGKNPIDAFIAARLLTQGLKPAPAASPATLIRRVYLDLTGLPPSPSDLAALSD